MVVTLHLLSCRPKGGGHSSHGVLWRPRESRLNHLQHVVVHFICDRLTRTQLSGLLDVDGIWGAHSSEKDQHETRNKSLCINKQLSRDSDLLHTSKCKQLRSISWTNLCSPSFCCGLFSFHPVCCDSSWLIIDPWFQCVTVGTECCADLSSTVHTQRRQQTAQLHREQVH